MNRKFFELLILLKVTFLITISLGASPDLPELLTSHRESIGTENAIRSIQSMILEQHLSMMIIEGSARTVSQAPDKYWTHIDTAVMTMTEACDGLTRWKQDQNGQVTRQEDTDRLPEPAPVLPDFQYLFPNDAITVQDIGTKMIDDTEFRLLQVDAPGYKKPRIKYIDPVTGRCMREELEQEGISMTMIYSDFMTVAGITLPGKTVQEVSIQGLPPTIMTVTSLRFNELVDVSLFNPPGDGESDFSFPDSGQVTVPMTVHGEHLTINVGINGNGPVLFLLDSGAASTIIDCAYADELVLNRTGGMHALGVGGAASVDKIEVDRLAIGDFSIDELNLFCMDLSKIDGMLGLDGTLKGIIGYDLFARVIVKLDYAGGSLSLFDPAKFTYDGTGKPVQGELNNNLLCVDGIIDGDISGKLRIDTGAGGGLHLHAGYFRNHDLMDRFQTGAEMEVHGAGGKVTIRKVAVSSVKLGDYDVPKPDATLNTGDEQSVLDTMDAMATVGNQVLSQFVVYFDFPAKRLILEPSSKPSPCAPDALNRGGMTVSDAEDGSVVIERIRPGYPAEEAGLMKGDTIIQVGKLKQGKGLRADTVNRMMYAGKGASLRVKAIRNGETMRFRITMK